MTELGKSAKHMGHQHPRVLRKIDPEPLRATPKAKPKRKHEKPYGYAWEMNMGNKYHRQRNSWFKTQAQRDQAMVDFRKKWSRTDWIRLIGPVDRCSPPTPTAHP